MPTDHKIKYGSMPQFVDIADKHCAGDVQKALFQYLLRNSDVNEALQLFLHSAMI